MTSSTRQFLRVAPLEPGRRRQTTVQLPVCPAMGASASDGLPASNTVATSTVLEGLQAAAWSARCTTPSSLLRGWVPGRRRKTTAQVREPQEVAGCPPSNLPASSTAGTSTAWVAVSIHPGSSMRSSLQVVSGLGLRPPTMVRPLGRWVRGESPSAQSRVRKAAGTSGAWVGPFQGNQLVTCFMRL